MGLPNYQDISGQITGSAVVVIDSLRRVKLYTPDDHGAQFESIDLLFIDECEQVIQHLFGGTMDGFESLGAFSALRQTIRSAKQIVVADADLSTLSVDFIRSCLDWEPDSNERSEEYREAAISLNWQYSYTFDRTLLEAQVLAALANNERVAIPTFSKRQAAKLRKMIEQQTPGKMVGVVSSETTAELKGELADINTWVKNLDVLIYTPSMGSGVSIDLDGHFDRIIGFFHSGVGTAQDAHQMLHRVRKPKSKEIAFWLPSHSVIKERNTDQIRKTLLSLARDTQESGADRRDLNRYAVGDVEPDERGRARFTPRFPAHFDWYVETLAFEREHGGKGGALRWAMPRYLASLKVQPAEPAPAHRRPQNRTCGDA